MGRLCLHSLLFFGLTHRSSPDPNCVDLDAKEEAASGKTITVDNLTLINLFLRLSGPLSEARATLFLLLIQVGILRTGMALVL